jgi:uncharacterized protein
MIFVDTGAWFAATVPTDQNYAIAAQWLEQNREPLLTTDYVMSETLTLLRARGERQRAIQFGTALLEGNLATLYYLKATEIQQTWQIFRHFADKDWSFTDCASKLVMENLEIAQAFAFDHHFHQFGTVRVVPADL